MHPSGFTWARAQVMQGHAGSVGVQRQACRVLCSIAANRGKIQKQVAEAGGIELVLACGYILGRSGRSSRRARHFAALVRFRKAVRRKTISTLLVRSRLVPAFESLPQVRDRAGGNLAPFLSNENIQTQIRAGPEGTPVE
ncbi:hypothetical protein T484DRAFT_2739008 [Baffinella frigidus]|nr:hypothetical protein T484DRAFT_2739008 [Cryptophyta sp. CCMP2293]